jgi:hypothetical protein
MNPELRALAEQKKRGMHNAAILPSLPLPCSLRPMPKLLHKGAGRGARQRQSAGPFAVCPFCGAFFCAAQPLWRSWAALCFAALPPFGCGLF